MLWTTTHTIEGRPIREYKGIVFGDDFGPLGPSKASEVAEMYMTDQIPDPSQQRANIRTRALAKLVAEAEALGGNAVVDVRFDYSILQGSYGSTTTGTFMQAATHSILMVTAQGTAVVVE